MDNEFRGRIKSDTILWVDDDVSLEIIILNKTLIAKKIEIEKASSIVEAAEMLCQYPYRCVVLDGCLKIRHSDNRIDFNAGMILLECIRSGNYTQFCTIMPINKKTIPVIIHSVDDYKIPDELKINTYCIKKATQINELRDLILKL